MGTGSSLWLKTQMMGSDIDKVGVRVIRAVGLKSYAGKASPRGKRKFTSHTTDLLKMWILPDGSHMPVLKT